MSEHPLIEGHDPRCPYLSGFGDVRFRRDEECECGGSERNWIAERVKPWQAELKNASEDYESAKAESNKWNRQMNKHKSRIDMAKTEIAELTVKVAADVPMEGEKYEAKTDDPHCGRCGEIAERYACIGRVRFCHGDERSASCYELQLRPASQ